MQKFTAHFNNKNFLCLWLAQIISQFGDRINQMALIGLIAARFPGSALGLAKVLTFTILPVFIVGPIAGVYVDRWDRRVTLFVCDIIRGLLILTIPLYFIFWNSLLPVYVIVFLTFSLSRFYVPAKMSIIPDLVEEKDLLVANSLVTVTGMIAFVLGCAFGGMLVEWSGARGGFFWDALTFFCSALLIMFIQRNVKYHLNREKVIAAGREMIRTIKKSVFAEFKEGVEYLIGHREIRFILNMMFVLFAAAGAIYVVIIVFVQEAFNSVTRDLGLLAVFLGIGLFCGSLLYGRWGEKASRFKTIFVCLIGGGVMLIIFCAAVGGTRNFILAAALALMLGLVAGPIFIAANTVIHEVSHDHMRGKVFGGLEVVMHFAFLLTMWISSWLTEFVESFIILVVVGGVFTVVGGVGLLRYGNQRGGI